MKEFKKLFLATLISGSLITGCGSGGSDDDDDESNGGGGDGTTISGTASAPGGMVAQLRSRNLIELAAHFFIPPAMAEVIGLQPVTGATVELIRVDNDGNQVGEVLATTSTSITGDYTLTLPVGVNLSGDLVVRITGNGGMSMRAQVVEQSVDITPVSEFVLRKYINNGADLDSLVVGDIVKLKGRVADFDLTAGADLTEMLAKLENEVGEFVDNSVTASLATSGDASTFAGAYRSSAFSLRLHDSDATSFGRMEVSVYQSEFNFADAGSGSVTITMPGEESSYLSLSGNEQAASIYHAVSTDDEVQSFTAPFASNENGILTVNGEFEEEIDLYTNNCCGWRWLPATYRLQKVPDRGLFFMIAEDAAVRYLATDTNNDGTPDAVDPNAREGDEVERSLEIFARKPADMTPSDLAGDFGRVWIGATISSTNRAIELETETNVITFNGNGSFDYGAVASHQMLSRNGYTTESEGAESGLSVVTTEDGDITSVAGEDVDAFINDTYDFIAFAGANADVSDGAGSGSSDKTLMMKLGAGTPTVTGNVYRSMSMGMRLSGTALSLASSRFDSKLTMTSESAGTLSLKRSAVQKADLGGDISLVNSSAEASAVTASIGNKGATTLTVQTESGEFVYEGFFNADATMGIFRSTFTATDAETPTALGVVILVKVN